MPGTDCESRKHPYQPSIWQTDAHRRTDPYAIPSKHQYQIGTIPKNVLIDKSKLGHGGSGQGAQAAPATPETVITVTWWPLSDTKFDAANLETGSMLYLTAMTKARQARASNKAS